MRLSVLPESLFAFALPLARKIPSFFFALLLALASKAQSFDQSFVLHREGRTISVEPYGPNIVRVTLSTNQQAAVAHPGYGFVATPSNSAWTHTEDPGYDVFRSA